MGGTGDRKRVAFMNAHRSSRGSICEKHTVLTWVVKLQRLAKEEPGSDPTTLLNAWNQEATVDSAFTGGKRVGVLNLLQHCDEATLDHLVMHHSKMGMRDFVFTDDSFANKKLLPGHRFRSLQGGPAWSKRLQVTTTSFNIFIRTMVAMQEHRLPCIRRKAEKKQLEDMALLSALAHDVQTELQAKHDISDAKIAEVFIDPFIQNDICLQVELQGILAERSPEFSPACVTPLRLLIADHKTAGETLGAAASMTTEVRVAAG